jgi:hypothetical protein
MSYSLLPGSLAASRWVRTLAVGVFALTLVLLQATPAHTQGIPQPSASVSIFATGLNNPRGLTFGPDGNLYVAEGGLGGTNSTVGQCTQVVPPVGPYTGGLTARISKISPAGVRTTVIDQLPSAQTSPALGSDKEGVAAVAFIGDTLYTLLVGGGCSHGNANVPNGIYRVNRDQGTWTLVANLSQFVQTHPITNPDVDDFEPDGDWYGMVAVRGALYATEANHQEVDRITPGGQISRVIDLSTLFVPPSNWQGATGIAYHGNFYIGTLGTFPVRPGTQSLYKITPSGSVKAAASGLTAVLGVAFDARGRLYALETITAAGFPGPGALRTGQVVCVNGNGTLNTVASGLTFPTGMAFGPDGNLYVSNNGFGPFGAGAEILRINTSAKDCT